MTRVLLYSRQSVEKEDGDKSLSIDSQIATLRARARKEGWTIVGEEREAGLRGWMDEADRPGLARCIARATAGDYDVLLVWDMSRLARSVRLQEDWIFRLARAGVDVVSHTEPHASDEMIRVIFGAIHQRQTKITAANVQRALTERARRGYHHGRAPFGYERDPETKKLIPHPTRAAIVRELFDRYIAGETLSELTRDLSRRRVPTLYGGAWERSTVQTIITNPVYAGRVRFGGVVVEDAHPPLVSPELWDRAQARRSSYPVTRCKDVSSWLEGRITHACGARMYLTTCGRRSPAPHFLCARRQGYFPVDAAGDQRDERCAVHPGRVRQDYAERQAWLLIVRAVRSVRDEAAIIALLEQRHAERGPQVISERKNLTDRLRDAQERRQRAENVYLDGQRDRAWFDAEDAALAVMIADTERALADLPVAVDRDEVAARRAGLVALADRVDDILPRHRGLILAELGTIVIGPGRNRHPSVHLRLDDRIRPYVPDEFYR